MIETGHLLQQRYRIDRQIGQGGMGAVYVATDERFNSTVAIKETLCMDDNYRKAIEREARLLNSLKHPALPRVSDHFLESDGQFLVMEYIAGEDLFCILERDKRPFPVEQVLTWADQLLDALDFLHNQVNPVIHRDIKPQNLKVTGRGQIILLDFGLAKGNPTDAANHTAAKSIFGYSRNYASLEQIQGTGTDPRSDLYSLSATLYHLLTGHPPEDALTRAMAVLSNRPDPIVPANSLNPELPAGVAVVLQRALDLNAGMRPSSAAAMREMLREHERYASAAVTAPAAPTPAGHALLDEKTRLMKGATVNDDRRPTNVKTEILPEYTSEQTRVRAFSSSNNTKTSRLRRSVPKALAAAFLLAGGAVAGAFFYGTYERTDRQQATAVESRIEEPPVNAAVGKSEPSLITDEADARMSESEEQKIESEVERAETVRPKASVRRSRPAARNRVLENDTVQPDGHPGTVSAGNVMIRKGSIQTPTTYIDENGIRRKVPGTPVRPLVPGIRFNTRYMTPEQRRKLHQMLTEKGVTPPPKPTPQYKSRN